MPTGILIVDKASGDRSTGCVAAVRKLLGRRTKVGHAGTLDSPASGVLLVLVGGATRLSSFGMQLPKEYLVEASFGRRTSTDDSSGEVLSEERPPSREHLLTHLRMLYPSFLGCRLQTPPRVSAVHVEGERAHDLARKGKEFAIAPRPVFIWRIEQLPQESPEEAVVNIRIRCSKGTYIRSLVRDLGDLVGCGAYVKKLRRLRVGAFLAEEGVSSERLAQATAGELESCVLPVSALVRHYATYRAQGEAARLLAHGVALPLSQLAREGWGSLSPESGVFALAGDYLVAGQIRERGEALFCPDAVIPLQEE